MLLGFFSKEIFVANYNFLLKYYEIEKERNRYIYLAYIYDYIKFKICFNFYLDRKMIHERHNLLE